MSEEKVEKKRFRRTKIAIERDVLQAVGSLIEELGFSNVTLTGVARRAKIEPAVFYRRYNNLEELFDKYTQKYDYWLAGVGRPAALQDGSKIAEIYNETAKKMVESLVERNTSLPPTEAVKITTMAGCSPKK
jgi:AcrR family transcriptional regulator